MLIIHGDNILASRDHFLSLKNAVIKDNLLELSGTGLSFAQFMQSISTPNLFGEYPVVFIEHFFSRRPGSDKKQIVDRIKTLSDTRLYFYESKDVTAQIKSIDPKFVKNFPLPKNLYTFLETLSLKSLQDCLVDLAPELLLASLGKHLHNLILVKGNQGGFPDWQAAKLRRQSVIYSLTKLVDMQKQLLQIDLATKTSVSPLDLKSALELWCLKNI